jgi:hypothetical protein
MMRGRSLPQVVVAIPCHAEWSAMTPLERDGSVRFCESCDKPVYEARAMTRSRLHDLITRHEGQLPCMRLHLRPDGTVVTRDCFAPLVRWGRAAWLRIGLCAAAFWGWAFGIRPTTDALREALTWRASAERLDPPPHVAMGGVKLLRYPSPPRKRVVETPAPAPFRDAGAFAPTFGLLAPRDRAEPLRRLQADIEEPAEQTPRD